MRPLRWLFLLPLLTWLTGCATLPPAPPPLTPAQVIAMAQAGMSDDEIIRQIEDSRTVFRLGAGEIVKLRQEGVSETVVNHLLERYIRYRINEQRRQDLADYEWRWRFRYFYGHPWHCW